MTKSINLILFLAFTVGLNAQNLNSNFKIPVKKGTPSKAISSFSVKGISPYTAFLVNDLNVRQKSSVSNITSDSSLIKKYNLISVSNVLYANAFLYITENFDEQELKLLVNRNSIFNKNI